MPQIGWLEILIIVSLAIVIIGPKDFPIMLKKIGSWIGSIKGHINNFQNQISNIDKIDLEEDNNQKNKSKEKNSE